MEHDQRWIDQIYSHKVFAGLDALDPCMIKGSVAGISTVLEPSTAISATTEFAGFLDAAALGTRVAAYLAAYRGHAGRRRGCFCGHVHVKQHKNTQTLLQPPRTIDMRIILLKQSGNHTGSGD